MYKILDRNRNMYNLSIAALVLYILLVLISLVGPRFFINPNGIACFYMIMSFIIMFVLWFGYISVYVLWTPDSEGAKRNRPTWQFVLLLATTLISRILNSIISLMITNIEFGDFWTAEFVIAIRKSELLSLIGNIIHYMLLPVILVMIIILLVKCERKAKIIMIIYTISSVLAIGWDILQHYITTIDDRMLYNKWVGIMSDIDFFVSIICSILLLTFTLVYTRQKYNEVKLQEPDIGTLQ